MTKPFLLSLIVALTSLASLASAAPLCRSVLQAFKPKTAHAIEISIRELAEMKLQLDTSQVSGNPETIHTVMKSQYPKLLAEVVRSQKGIHSEKEISSMIKKAIHELQEKVGTEKRQAEIQKEILFRMPYTLKETGPEVAKDLINSLSDAFFIPQRETIYAIRKGALRATDFEGRDSIIVPAEAFTVLENGAKLLLKKDDKLITVTTDNNQIRSTYEIGFRSVDNSEAKFENLQVNSDGKYVLMKGLQSNALHRYISIIDISNQNEVFHHGKLSGKATDAVFVGKNQIAVLYEKEKIEIVEIPSGKVIQSRKIDLDELGLPAKIAISKNGASLAVFNDLEILSFPTHDISLEARSLKQNKDTTTNRNIDQASGYPIHLLESDYTGGGKLIDLETMTVDFDFQGRYGKDDNNLFRFFPSPDGKTILALYSQKDGIRTRYKIDTWEQGFFTK